MQLYIAMSVNELCWRLFSIYLIAVQYVSIENLLTEGIIYLFMIYDMMMVPGYKGLCKLI